jgi:PTH1 family peptidyl-tRNA hydrolase
MGLWMTDPETILIVGLGNPGTVYSKTRHNVGFMTIDYISDSYNFTQEAKPKWSAIISFGKISNRKIILLKPTTFMNLSGKAVQAVCSYYRIGLEQVFVIHDDVDLELGRIKVKTGGGRGGHNGLKSIDQIVGNAYSRIRIGIGRPNFGEVSDFVLGKFSNVEKEIIHRSIVKINDNIKSLADQDIEGFKKKTQQS